MGPGQWQHVRIEFEFESKNFHYHGHDATKCDIIVCWKHNWPDKPEHLDVVELRQVVRHMAGSRPRMKADRGGFEKARIAKSIWPPRIHAPRASGPHLFLKRTAEHTAEIH